MKNAVANYIALFNRVTNCQSSKSSSATNFNLFTII